MWRSFELDPTAPARSDLSMSEVLQRKYRMTEEQAEEANAKMTALAAGVGLEYHLDRVQRSNTFDAHRLIHLAASHGLADATEERLFAAYFTEGRPSATGPPWSGWPWRWASTPTRSSGCWPGTTSPPRCGATRPGPPPSGPAGSRSSSSTRRYGVSGAQPADVLLGVLEQAWAAEREAADR